MLNLISNSLKFTDKGYIEIKIEKGPFCLQNKEILCSIDGMRISDNDVSAKIKRNTIRVTIKDTGYGISEENQKKLFSLYETFGNEKYSNSNGTGLGLIICRSLVALLGPYE